MRLQVLESLNLIKMKDRNKYPKGWNQKRVQKLIKHYENQTDEEAILEDEQAVHNEINFTDYSNDYTEDRKESLKNETVSNIAKEIYSLRKD